MQGSEQDPFGTAELRRRVLDAWAASPARFREDANAEEDYALGGYRDRVVVELAQNAADAAARAGVPGRLRLTLRADGTLIAANTGAPLDAAGVEALSTLRASSKRGSDDRGPHGRPVRRGLRGRGRGQRRAAASLASPARWPGRARQPASWSRASPRWPPSSPRAAATCRCCGCRSRAGRTHGPPPDGLRRPRSSLPLRDEAAVALVRRLLAETGAGAAAGPARAGRR